MLTGIIFNTAIVAYPVIVVVFLLILKLPLRLFSLCFIMLAIVYMLSLTGKARRAGKTYAVRAIVFSAVLLGLCVACFLTNSDFFIKLYPVIINAVMLAGFAGSFIFPPAAVFRLACLQDKTIKGSLAEKKIERYCVKVTLVWCAFFVLNGLAALYTVLAGGTVLWSLYNGGISYMLMGTLFAVELFFRKRSAQKMPRAIPLSRIGIKSRPSKHIVCYSGLWQDKKYKTWDDFLDDTQTLRQAIKRNSARDYILYCEDAWYFLTAFTALLQCGKNALITANVSPAYLAEIRSEDVAFFTDQNINDSVYVPDLLADGGNKNQTFRFIESFLPITADETGIVLYTSGTTGTPKAVRQRLTEFEADNAFIISKWGDEILKRRFVSTVSHHHIYGLLFSVLLPFTCGVPFRRKRIGFSEEFEKFSDDSYMIVTVPAFLKRAADLKTDGAFPLKDPWIWSSGGVLPFETAKAANELFGFWPLEVYGSTETSGIAYRQSKNGPEWTPFDNAAISKNDEGCLVVRSPYIKDAAGFTTGDLADILEDGRFLLKGRADSIVKIEEKRVSLHEIESRLMQSGFLSDAYVFAMTGKTGRQFLCAAIVFNAAGKVKFDGTEKHIVNKWWRSHLSQFFELVVVPRRWRFLEALPQDAQGKKNRSEIQKLFTRITA